MTPIMKEKIDGVLSRVKEPESGLSIAQLNFVERFRYNESKKKLYVILNSIQSNRHHCCTVIQGLLISGTLKVLNEEFKKEFPELNIEII